MSTNHTEISVEEIMRRIREEVHRRKALLKEAASSATEPKTCTILQSHLELEPFDFPSEPLTLGQRSYHLHDLLRYHDRDFVINAYRAILGREPDPDGFEHYLHALRSGRMSKIEIIGRLRFSPEGKTKGVKVKGLLIPLAFHFFYKIPVIGYLSRLFTGLANLPTIFKNFEKFEAFQHARWQEFQDRLQRNQEKIISAFDIINQNLNSLRELVEARAEREELERRVSELSNRFSEELGNLNKQILIHKRHIVDMERRLGLLLEEARKRFPEPISEEQIQEMVKEEDHLLDALYVSLEDRFRGTREDIKERLKIYLPYVRETLEKVGRGLVLDVGCGRGEWLELLKENSIEAIGVDINRVMIDQCQELGLEVIEGDAIDYLRGQKDNTFAVITGFHIVEHLPLKKMIALFDECLRVLKPGGMVIFETPNPKNLVVGACNFYSDPTHNNPCFPETLQFLLEFKGFTNIYIEYLNPIEGSPFDTKIEKERILHNWFFCARDYAVIAYKP